MLKKIVFILVVFLSSCYNYNTPEKPSKLISKDKMVNILLDLKLANSVTGKDKNVLDSAKLIPEQFIYKKYNVDSIQFAESNAYYTFHMKDYTEIYAQVKDSLKRLESYYNEILAKEKEEKRKKDSIRRKKNKLKKPTKFEKNINKSTIDELEGLELIEPISDIN